MLRDATYTGVTPIFWGKLEAVAGPDEWVRWGTPNCEGQPMQIAGTAHRVARPVPQCARRVKG
jgi:TldD protein